MTEHKTKIVNVDGELGVELPPDLLESLGLSEGDTVYYEDRDGKIFLRGDTPPDKAEESDGFAAD